MKLTVDMELLRCRGCGRTALSLVDGDGIGLRITPHKCAGAWTRVEVLRCEFTLAELLAHAQVEEPAPLPRERGEAGRLTR